MMETKKRPLSDDTEMAVAKKRAVASITDSPVAVNGKTDPEHEEPQSDNLESFRKAAIFRRMKHYSRENERAQDKIIELENRSIVLEANVAAIGACWEQLVQELYLLVKPEVFPDEPPIDNRLYDLSVNVDPSNLATPLSDTLQEHGRATQKLVSTFINFGPKAPAPDGDHLLKQCSKLQTQVAALRAELRTVNSRLTKAESDKELYYAKLLTAESRLDRSQGASAQVMNSSSALPDKEEDKPQAMEEVKEEGEGNSAMSNHDGQPLPNGIVSSPAEEDYQDWRALYKNCDKLNVEMCEEIVKLKALCDEQASELASPSQQLIEKAPLYQVFLERLQNYRSDAESYKEKYTELTRQVHELREMQEHFKERLIADYNVRYDEQKSMIVKRDHENVRLREQRDTLQGEINEMKSRVAERRSTAQFQILLQSRTDRITALETENKCLKSQLSAKSGREDLLELILGDKLKDLPERLQETQRKFEALQTSLATLDASHPDVAQHIRSESEAREVAATTLTRLKRFESLFGGDSFPPDYQALVNQLREKDEMLRIVNLQREQEQAASSDLFSEIERLSAAWEVLDRQNKSKVFDMDAMEVKLQRMAGEKAKADNKYFSAMRQKEAAEAERKAGSRTVEKLQKAIERFTDAEKGFSAKITSQEREISIHKGRCQTFEEHATTLERELNEKTLRYQELQKQLAEMKRRLTDAQAFVEQRRLEARRLEEDNIRARKEAELQSAKANAVSPGKGTSREEELQREFEKCMKLLRCSTCKQNLRSHVLTKCMHSFCKACVQARIDTRQRKCPACNMGFTQGEFQQLYFQG